LKFALFFLGEYVNAMAVSFMFAVLFLGGYAGPVLPPYIWLLIKVGLVFFVLMWLRGTLPRVRVDQLMSLNWKFLVPMSIVNILVVAVLAKVFVADAALAASTGGILVAPAVQALILFLANIAVLLVGLTLVARRARALRLVEAEDWERRRTENMAAAGAH
jgi:NADH-quinone oxidoreductase subunit H